MRADEDRIEAGAGAPKGTQTAAIGGFPIVGIGASAGGLEAFTELLTHLAPDTGMGYVLVQHLDPVHESALTQLLARATRMPVHEVTHALPVAPNHVYVIPPNTSLTIQAGVLHLQPREKTRLPARSIDTFLESLAADQHERAVGIILSGTASDGTLGLEAIKAEGGITFAQDDTAKYDSMPRSAVAAGCVDYVLAPAAIAQELARLAAHPYVAGLAAAADDAPQSRPEADHAHATTHQDDGSALPSGGSGEPDVGAERARSEAEQAPEAGSGQPGSGEEAGFKRVLHLLHNHCGVDFSLYKSSTIQRRIARRMLLGHQETLAGYAEHLRGNAKELDTLFSDVLISVTSFFRNPDAFAVLEREVLPKLLAQRGDDPLRVWVLGCSTGQEAYSVAMAFVEASEKVPQARKLQVFATDLNDALLDKARNGLYAKTLAADLSPERLHRFFVEEGGGYRVAKSLREMVVFARQNIVTDPPFSRIDIITCRNLLIYLEPSLQRKIFPLFHYALKPRGFLWLGSSESIGGFTELFEPLDRKQKIYVKKAASTPTLALSSAALRGGDGVARTLREPAAASHGASAALHSEHTAQREADRVSVSQYAPPGVLIDAKGQILEFRGVTSAFLEAPSGVATLDVLKMAREGLRLPLGTALQQAAKENRAVRKNGLRIEHAGGIRNASLEVIPLKNLRERCFLVSFENAQGEPPVQAPAPAHADQPAASASEHRGRIAELENDLHETRQYLRAVQEVHEAAVEELQAANEEVQSANEELQSLNEELTTSKEELESSNEELTTVSDEMAYRNAELMLLGNDLINVQTSAQLVIVLLGRDLTVRRFSAQAGKQFNLIAGDIGRPIGHIRHRLVLSDLEALVSEVIDEVRPHKRELQDVDGRWYILQVRPYLTLDNRVDGAVLVLADIDTLKRSEQALQASEDQYSAMFAATNVGVCECDPTTGRLLRVNQRFAQLVGYTEAEALDKTFIELTHAEDRQADWDAFVQLVQGDAVNYESEKRLCRKNGGDIWVLTAFNVVRDADGHALRVVVVTLDIGARKIAEQATARLAAIVTSTEDAIVTLDLAGVIQTWNDGAERLLGFTAEEAVGQPPSLLVPPDRSGEEETVLATVQRGQSTRYETVRQHKDGRRIDVALTVSPIRDAAGHIVGAAKIARDITERKRIETALRDSERRFREMVDALPAAVFTTDMAGRLTHYNPAAVELAGTEPALGSDAWFARLGVHSADGRQLAQSEAPLGDGAVHDALVPGLEATLERPDGSRVWVRPYPSSVHNADGHVVGSIHMLVDITESRRAAETLREADRRKNEFLAMLAHELRNPLAPIRNALQILRIGPAARRPIAADGLERSHEQGAQANQSALQMMERQVAQMVRLVDDLLDVSRISLGKIGLLLERVNLAAVLHQVEQAARAAFEAGGVTLKLTLPPQTVVVRADPARLVQIVGNLVNNACKFTPRGGAVELRATLDGSSTVVIRVCDDGIGIDAADLPRVFQLFTQVDSSMGRTSGGLGIGLSLVKDLVALHGGTVAVHSQGLGHGSEFELRLPIVIGAEAAPADAAPEVAAQTSGRRILVVDDNLDAANSMAYLLQVHGHETELAHDGLAAVEAAGTWLPDVILMDLGLPKLDGLEATRRIRAQRADKRPLIVALTGWGQEDDRRLSADAGFDGHLVKPVKLEALLKLLG